MFFTAGAWSCLEKIQQLVDSLRFRLCQVGCLLSINSDTADEKKWCRHEGSVVIGLLEIYKVRCNSQCFSDLGETGDTADGMY